MAKTWGIRSPFALISLEGQHAKEDLSVPISSFAADSNAKRCNATKSKRTETDSHSRRRLQHHHPG
jgi:hypothetical protein